MLLPRPRLAAFSSAHGCDTSLSVSASSIAMAPPAIPASPQEAATGVLSSLSSRSKQVPPSPKLGTTCLSDSAHGEPNNGDGIHHVDPFCRWRPSSHLIAPKNWMNDPCGPCYDPATRRFHLLYQYNPYGASWGNMSWMHAVSKDLIHWRHVTEEPALVPSQPHDAEGVFSGVMIPSGPCGEPGLLTAIYTAVSQLPIHYTKPYRPGSEKLAMAISQDDGKTWQRNKASVVLDGPPDSLASDIVSWRDPYIAPWPAMDEKLALPPGRFIYGLISGGLRGKTPALFLYRIERNDIGKWTHVAQLADVGLNFTLGEHAGDMGQNWEVCNFFLDGPDTFLLINVEGVDGVPKRRHAMWTKTDIKCTGQGDEIQGPQVRMEPRYSALIDYGCLYAATTFEHAPTGRRILWGWVTEDDLAEEQCEAQGWAGCMSLPREISTSVYQDVDAKLLKRPLFAHSFWPLQSARLGTKASHDVATIGHRPAAETVQLRTGATHFAISDPPAGFTLPYHSRNFELCVDVEVAAATGGSSFGSQEVGVFIAHNADATLGTKVVYSFEDEMLRVDRSASSTSAHVDRSTKWAPLGLVRFADGSWEPLRLHVYLDNSVLEVFANGRVSLTTRIYCDSPDCARVSLLPSNAKGGGSAATATAASGAAPTRFARVEAWVGLQKAMLPTHPFDAFACPDAI